MRDAAMQEESGVFEVVQRWVVRAPNADLATRAVEEFSEGASGREFIACAVNAARPIADVVREHSRFTPEVVA